VQNVWKDVVGGGFWVCFGFLVGERLGGAEAPTFED